MALNSNDIDVFNMALDLLKEATITSSTDDEVSDWYNRNYAVTRDAELREHRWRFARKRRTLYPFDYVLEGNTATLTGAWGLMRLTDKWHGDIVEIRRDSDDTTDDFGLGTDEGDSQVLVDADAIETFVGTGNSGYVATLYDQSGLGNDLAQATTTKQPLYIGSNQADAQINGGNDRPVASFDGTDDILATTTVMSSLMSVSAGYMVIAGLIDALTLDSATESSNHLLMGEASKNIGLYVRKGGQLYAINNDGSEDAAAEWAPKLVPFVAEIWHDSGSIYVRINGEDEASATSGASASLAGVLDIGDIAAGSQALDFKMFAAAVFSTVPTEAERNELVDRLRRHIAVPGYKEFGYSYRYPLPSDYIGHLAVKRSGADNAPHVDHVVSGGYILCNVPSKIYVDYTSQFTNALKFDPLFKEAFAGRLAAKLAHWLTHKMGMADAAGKSYKDAVMRAKAADAIEGDEEAADMSDVIEQRYDVLGVR